MSKYTKPNPRLLHALKKQNERANRDRAMEGFVNSAFQGYHRAQQMNQADALGQQLGLPKGAARNVHPSVLAQAALAQQQRAADAKQRRSDMEYQIGEQRSMAEAEREADRQRWVRTEGNRQDEFDRTQDLTREQMAAMDRRYSSQDQNLLQRERLQQEGANFREGVQQIGNTVRGVGGGIKDLAVAAMRRRQGSGGGGGGFGLSDDAHRFYSQKLKEREGIQQQIRDLQITAGDFPSPKYGTYNANVNSFSAPQKASIRAEIDRLSAIDAALAGELQRIESGARGGQYATPVQDAPQASGDDDYDRF